MEMAGEIYSINYSTFYILSSITLIAAYNGVIECMSELVHILSHPYPYLNTDYCKILLCTKVQR